MLTEIEKKIVDRLLEHKKLNGMSGVQNAFTTNLEAEQLIKDDWNAFLFAVILDQQIGAERAWATPLELKKRLGHLDVFKIAKMDDDELLDIFKKPFKLHRWVNKMPKWIKSACVYLVGQYEGRAENIWKDTKDARIIIERFDDFDGIGQKKSTMAVNFLADYFKIPITNWESIDISVDIMVRRVFQRSGLVSTNATDADIINKARELMPSFPGGLDFASWDIGRYWCLPKNPYCFYKENGKEDNCPLVKECPSARIFSKINSD